MRCYDCLMASGVMLVCFALTGCSEDASGGESSVVGGGAAGQVDGDGGADPADVDNQGAGGNANGGTGSDSGVSSTFPKKLSVQGRRVVDSSGASVVLRGVNAFPPIWQAMGEDPDVGAWDESSFDAMQSWGVQIVRLALYPAHIRRYGYDASLEVVDQAIDWAGARGMYVIIDFHSIGYVPDEDYQNSVDVVFGQVYETSRDDMFEFWDIISKRYRDNDAVAFYELFNEPALDQARDYPADYTLNDWMTWKALMEELIDAIRINDPEKIVMVAGFQFAYDLSFVLQAPIERTNVVYTTHPYPDVDWQKNWDTAFGSVAKEYPVFATEFGFDGPGGFPESAYNGDGVYHEALAEIFNARGIGWTAWDFSHAMTPRLLEAENASPTPAGTFVREQLQLKSPQ